MSIKCAVCDGDSFTCGGCGALYESYELRGGPNHDAQIRADQQAKILAILGELSNGPDPGELRRGYNLGISAAIRIVEGVGRDS